MASIIQADLEALRALADEMRRGGETLHEQFEAAHKAFGALQGGHWRGRHRAQAEERWEAAAHLVPTAVESVGALAQRVHAFAERLDQAAAQLTLATATAVSGSPTPVQTPATPPVSSAPPVSNPSIPATSTAVEPSLKPMSVGATSSGVLNQLSGCTHYVASKVNLNDWGRWPNAEQWNDVATKQGYSVNQTPAQGSVMVFEKGVLGASQAAGHVAYVEQVAHEGDVYRITVSEANVPYDAHGNAIFGAHTAPDQRTISLKVGGDGGLYDTKGGRVDGVTFIHGK